MAQKWARQQESRDGNLIGNLLYSTDFGYCSVIYRRGKHTYGVVALQDWYRIGYHRFRTLRKTPANTMQIVKAIITKGKEAAELYHKLVASFMNRGITIYQDIGG